METQTIHTELTNPELIRIRDDYNRFAAQKFTLTKAAAPDGFLYTIVAENGEPYCAEILPDGDITSMTLSGDFAFRGKEDGYMEGGHFRECCRLLNRYRKAAGDEELRLRTGIALHKLTTLAHLAE